jgi:hypothetical protein
MARPPDPGELPQGADPTTEGAERAGERKGFLLRLPAPLMAELRTWAEAEVRSLNGHIEYLLREAVRRRKR